MSNIFAGSSADLSTYAPLSSPVFINGMSLVNSTPATATVPQNSPIFTMSGTYWTGAASAVDSWTNQDIISTTSIPITNIVETAGNTVTLTVTGNTRLVTGQNVLLNGLTTGAWLNGLVVTLTGATAVALIFTDPTAHGVQSTTATTGTAVGQSSVLTFTQSGLTAGTAAMSAVRVPSLSIGAEPLGLYKLYLPYIAATLHQAYIAGMEVGGDGNGPYIWMNGAASGTIGLGGNTPFGSSGSVQSGSITFTSLPLVMIGKVNSSGGNGSIVAGVFGGNQAFNNVAPDAGLSRFGAPGIFAIGNGLQGDFTGTLQTTNVAANLIGSNNIGTSLVTPGTPTITKVGANTGATWGYKIVAKDLNGNVTAASAEGTIANDVTLTPALENTITNSAVVKGAVSYDVYRTTVGTTPSTTGLLRNLTVPTFAVLVNSPMSVIDPGQCTVTSVANGTGVYTGTFTGGGANAFAGLTFIIAGFVTSANNGTFLCTASTAANITVVNASSASESHAATATTVADGTTAPTVTTAVGAKLVNATAATVSVAQPFPSLTLSGQYWATGAVTGEDKWVISHSIAAGLNGASTLVFTHTGSTGLIKASFQGASLLAIPNIQMGTAPTVNASNLQGLQVLASGTSLGLFGNNITQPVAITLGNTGNMTATALATLGIQFGVAIGTPTTSTSGLSYAPTSLSTPFAALAVLPVINETGTSTSPYTALLVSPLETAYLGAAASALLADFQIAAGITNVVEDAGSIVTLVVVNSKAVTGQSVFIHSMTQATWLNGQTVVLTTGTATSMVFADPTVHGVLSTVACTGRASLSVTKIDRAGTLIFSNDAGISRLAAGSLAIGNGTAGSLAGLLQVNGLAVGGSSAHANGNQIALWNAGSVRVLQIYASGPTQRMASDFTLAWTPTTNAETTADTGISRIGVASLAISDGTVGDTSGVLTANKFNANEILVAALATPVNAAFATATTGGTLAPDTYYYRVAATDAVGTTLASTETSQVVPAGTSTNTVTVNWAKIAGATGYKVYGRLTGAELLMATITSGSTITWVDLGSVTPSGALPTVNTTGVIVTSVGAVGTPSFTFSAHLTSGFYFDGARGTVSTTINGADILRVGAAATTLVAGILISPNGTGAAPTYTFASANTNGMYYDSARGFLSLVSLGAVALQAPVIQIGSGFDTGVSRLGAASLAIGNGTAADFSGTLKLANLSLAGTGVALLTTDAADVLAQRNGTTQQRLRVYNTFTNSSNYELLQIGYLSNVAHIIHSIAGTGAARNLVFGSTNANAAGSITITSGSPADIVLSQTATAGKIRCFVGSGGEGLRIGTANDSSYMAAVIGGVEQRWDFVGNLPVKFTVAGVTALSIVATGAGITIGGLDAGISRLGAASLAIGNGTAGDITGNLSLNRINKAGADMAGQATITAGGTTQAVTFAANYTGTGQPVIILTPTSDPLALGVPVGYWVTYSGSAGAWTGFTVNIQTALAGNITFNYHVMGVA